MVSGPETIPFCLLVTSSDPTKEEILARVASLEEKVEELRQENQELREENEQLRQENKRFRAKLRWYEGPHTPPSKDQSDHVTVVRLVESQDMTRSGVTHLTQIKKSRSPMTAVQSVAKRSTSRRASASDSSRNSQIHSHQKSHSTTATTTSVTPVEPRLSVHTPTAPMRGSSR